MQWCYGLLTAACLIGMYLLYDNGYLLVQAKRALTFIGSGMGKRDYFAFQFTGCTGYVSRVLRVKESATYTVTLNATLSKGTVRFTMLDGARTPLLVLTPERNSGKVYLETGMRYHIRMDFTHASGDSRARWEKE